MTLDKNTKLVQRICGIKYQLVSNINTLTKNLAALTQTVTFTTGTWLDLYGTPGKFNFTENEEEPAGGDRYDQHLQIVYPGEDSDNLTELNAIAGVRAIVRIEYESGMVKVLGDAQNPVKLKLGYAADPVAGTTLSASRNSSHRALILV